jgi:DNA polymerase III sliding clamp (beta) subunit (PCNA family)
MKLNVKRKELIKALKAVNAAKGSAFISVNAKGEETEAVLSGFGQNLAIRASVPVLVSSASDDAQMKPLGFNAEILIAALSAADDEEITADVKENIILVRGQKLSFKAPAKSGEKPQFAAGADSIVADKESASLFPLFVKKAEHATETGNIPILHSVNVSVYKDRSIRVVCTDGRRLAARGNVNASNPLISVSIDRVDADAMLSALGGRVEFLSAGKSFVCASAGNVFVAARTLSATFPDWENVIFSKRKEAGRLDVQRCDLLAACQLCGLVSDKKSAIAEFSSQGVHMSASGEYGNAENTVAVKGQIACGTVTQKFDMIFVSDALRSLLDENVTVSVAPSQPIVVTDSSGFEMIMPQRIR